MMIEIPYFMYNEEWYSITDDGYQLTDAAPSKARESFGEYKKYVKN